MSDSGKGISVKYNPLNLPKTVGGENCDIGYTYALSGEKVVKKTSSSDPEEEETRIYLGGAEFKDGKAESYYFGDGRVLMLETEPDRPQYNITDHLGNTVVTFEDRDEDGMIVTEAEETEEFAAEVVQRKVLSINV